jgi:hypothetical protein
MDTLVLREQKAECNTWRDCLQASSRTLWCTPRYSSWTSTVPGIHQRHARHQLHPRSNYLDDSLLYCTINNQTDSDLLQRDLTILEDWGKQMADEFQCKKCIVIRIALKNKQVRQTSYKLHGHTLDNVEASKNQFICSYLKLYPPRKNINEIISNRM